MILLAVGQVADLARNGAPHPASSASWPTTDNHYVQETETWRRTRVAELTAPDGWLSLIGLHFLRDGENRIGSAKDNDVVLAAGPAHVGRVTVAPQGAVSLALAAGIDARIGDTAARTAALTTDAAGKKPTLVTCGTMTLFAIERGGKIALRVKDSGSPRRRNFVGLDYFPIDPAWRIEARWDAFEKSRLMPITSMLGQTAVEPVPGKAVFVHEGKTVELLAIDEGPDKPLFFVISDATSGRETYPASRFIYAERPRDGKIVLDFNRAENPPCAFTPHATCPLPPRENRMTFPVRAGEKNYRGAHE